MKIPSRLIVALLFHGHWGDSIIEQCNRINCNVIARCFSFASLRYLYTKQDIYDTCILVLMCQVHWPVLCWLQPLGPKGPSYPEMGKEAVGKALQDANLSFEAVESAVSGAINGRLMHEVWWVADSASPRNLQQVEMRVALGVAS